MADQTNDIFWAPAGVEVYKQLQEAVSSGNEDLLKQIIGSNVRLDAYFGHQSSDDGRTALHIAAYQGNLSNIKMLLANGVDVNIMDRAIYGPRTPPLYCAALAANAEAVQLLIDAGARTSDIDSPTEDTILSVVLRQPQHSDEARIKTLSVLLDHGVDINAKYMSRGSNVLDFSIINENEKIIEFLRARGASFASALATAVRHNKAAIFQTLIDAGVTDDKDEALTLAAGSGKINFVNVLLQSKANNSQPVICSDPVCSAAAKGHVEIVRLLLDHGFTLDKSDRLGLMPLHHAVWDVRCNPEMVQLLLSRGADPLAKSVQGSKPWLTAGRTCLHLAADRCSLPIIRALLSVAPMQLHQRHGTGEYPLDTPLLTFVRAILQPSIPQDSGTGGAPARVQALVMLLDAGANVQDLDHQGRTALHILAALEARQSDYNRTSAAGLLIDRGVELTAKDHNGKLAFDLATDDAMRSMLDLHGR